MLSSLELVRECEPEPPPPSACGNDRVDCAPDELKSAPREGTARLPVDDDEAEKEKRPSMEDWERGGGTMAEDDAKLLSGSTVLRLVVRWSLLEDAWACPWGSGCGCDDELDG